MKGTEVRKEDMLGDVRTMLRKRGKFVFHNNLLYWKNKNQQKEYLQFVLPRNYRKQALEACHDEIGHLGKDRVFSLLVDQFY